MSTTDMTNPWRRGSKTAGAKHKRRAAIVRAAGRRKAKAECRHIGWRITWKDGELFAEHCRDCGARLSLGPSNDDVPADEMAVAETAARWLFQTLDAWALGESGSVEWGDGVDGWPWDPTRPVAGQFEEWDRQSIQPFRDALARETTADFDRMTSEQRSAAYAKAGIAQGRYAPTLDRGPALQASETAPDAFAAVDAHGYAKPGELPAEVVGLEVAAMRIAGHAEHCQACSDEAAATCRSCGDDCDCVPRPVGCECHWEIGDSPCPVHPNEEDIATREQPADSDAPAATYEPGGAE